MSFVTRQPNGKLCRFSTISDTPVAWNMTEQDYIDMCVEQAKMEAERDARDIINNPKRYMYDFDEVLKGYYRNDNTGSMSLKDFEQFLKDVGYESKEN